MKVKFLPSEEEHEIEFNETILHLAQRVGLHIQSVCKGLPSCAECRVQIVEGEHHVLPPSKKELDLIGTAHYVDLSRLSCQLRCFGDVVVDLAEQIEKEKRATDKPRDRMSRSDGERSRAVLGGILDNVVAADVELPADFDAEVEKVEVEHVKGAPKLDRKNAFYGDFYTGKKKASNNNNRNKNRNRNKKSGEGAKNTQQASSGGESTGGSKKKTKRRRNRNRRGPGAGGEAPKGNS